MLYNKYFKYQIKEHAMSFVDLILLPGTLVCRRMGIEPESDQGLIRSMFNMLIYLVVFLSALWIFM